MASSPIVELPRSLGLRKGSGNLYNYKRFRRSVGFRYKPNDFEGRSGLALVALPVFSGNIQQFKPLSLLCQDPSWGSSLLLPFPKQHAGEGNALE